MYAVSIISGVITGLSVRNMRKLDPLLQVLVFLAIIFTPAFYEIPDNIYGNPSCSEPADPCSSPAESRHRHCQHNYPHNITNIFDSYNELICNIYITPYEKAFIYNNREKIVLLKERYK
jgi:hypothetical protein